MGYYLIPQAAPTVTKADLLKLVDSTDSKCRAHPMDCEIGDHIRVADFFAACGKDPGGPFGKDITFAGRRFKQLGPAFIRVS